jgi:hypothetical protein
MPHFCTCGIFNIQGLTCGRAVYVLASDDHFVVWWRWSVRQDHLCTLRTGNAPSTCHRVRTGNIGIRSSILLCEYIVEKRLFMHTKCACAQVSLDIGADAVCSSRQPPTLTNVEDNGNIDLYLHPNFLEVCLRSRSPRQAQPLNRQTLSLLATDTPRYTETMVFFPDQPEDMFKHAFSDWEYRRDVAPANRNDVGLSTALAPLLRTLSRRMGIKFNTRKAFMAISLENRLLLREYGWPRYSSRVPRSMAQTKARRTSGFQLIRLRLGLIGSLISKTTFDGHRASRCRIAGSRLWGGISYRGMIPRYHSVVLSVYRFY